MMRGLHKMRWGVLMLALFGVLFLAVPEAHAVTEVTLADSCTDQPAFTQNVQKIQNILTDIIKAIDDKLADVGTNMYDGIITSNSYRYAVYAALSLYLIFYAVGFMFGFVPPTFGQALFRIIKIGVLFMIMDPFWGWYEFSNIVVQFFDGGTKELIQFMVDMGSNPACDADQWEDPYAVERPFCLMDGIVQKALSPKMFVVIIGSLTTGPFGPIMAIALAWTIFNLFMMILGALEVYLLSLIVRALLYGLAPIFFAFLLFERTKSLFTNWVNQLVSFSLQPVFMFAFLSFFVVMLESSLDAILPKVELCYTKMSHVGMLPFDIQHWRFKVDTNNDGEPEIYEGEFTWNGPLTGSTTGSLPPFPISVLDILIFLILAHIGIQMTKVATEIASEIANSSLKLDQIPGTVNSWFNGMKGGGHGGGMTENERAIAESKAHKTT